MDVVERKLVETDQKFERVFKALESKGVIPNRGVFFDGQVFDAYELASKIIRTAKSSIVLIDNHVNETEAVRIRKRWEKLKTVTETFVHCCENGNFAKIQEEAKVVARSESI